MQGVSTEGAISALQVFDVSERCKKEAGCKESVMLVRFGRPAMFAHHLFGISPLWGKPAPCLQGHLASFGRNSFVLTTVIVSVNFLGILFRAQG